MTDVFISYSHQNKDFVHKLREALNNPEIILQRPDEALYYSDLAVSYNNIGWIFEKQGNLDMAQKEYMAAIEPAKKAAEIDPGKWEKLYDIQRKISHSVN
jgi:tetratricopeptide (TPR) repeat protein